MSSYSLYCTKHRRVTTPLYWRPGGTTFRRCPQLHWCPGNSDNPHILKYLGFHLGTQNISIDTT